MFDLKLDVNPEPTCNGLVYRARENNFVNKRGEVVYSKRMSPLKRESCPGCENCGYMLYELDEWISMGEVPIVKDFKHGAVYRLDITNIQKDWETGYVDGYDLVFVKIRDY